MTCLRSCRVWHAILRRTGSSDGAQCSSVSICCYNRDDAALLQVFPWLGMGGSSTTLPADVSQLTPKQPPHGLALRPVSLCRMSYWQVIKVSCAISNASATKRCTGDWVLNSSWHDTCKCQFAQGFLRRHADLRAGLQLILSSFLSLGNRTPHLQHVQRRAHTLTAPVLPHMSSNRDHTANHEGLFTHWLSALQACTEHCLCKVSVPREVGQSKQPLTAEKVNIRQAAQSCDERVLRFERV